MIRIASDGSFILYEAVSSVYTSRGTSAGGSISNGQIMVVIAEGTTIKVFANNVLKITYSSALNYQSQKSGNFITDGTGSGLVTDIASWPRMLPSYLQAMLNRYVK